MALQLFKIETVEVASPVTSVTFSSIPQGYTDLIIKASTRDATNNDNNTELKIKFNGSATSYVNKYIQGNGSTVVTGTYATTYFYTGESDSLTATTNTFGNSEHYIPNYTSANYKSMSSDLVSEDNATVAYTNLAAGLWSNTAAITSIEFTCNGSFATNSTFTLYGVL